MVGLTQPAGEMETRMPDDEGNLLMICNDGHCKLKHGLDDRPVTLMAVPLSARSGTDLDSQSLLEFN